MHSEISKDYIPTEAGCLTKEVPIETLDTTGN